MNKLLKLAQAKGKWHKFPSFNSGWEAKLYKNFAQKLLAVSLCMAVVLLGTPVTTFAEDDVPVAQSVYIKATNVPELKVGEALPSLDDVQLEVTVFAPGVSSPSVTEVLSERQIWRSDTWELVSGAVTADVPYVINAVFNPGSSFEVNDKTTFASNLGMVESVLGDTFAVALPLVASVPVVTVDVVDVPDLVVGQPFPELGPDNFTVSVLPADGFDVTSASVVWAGWVTTSDWTPVADSAVVQPGVSYGIGTIVVGGGAFCAGPSDAAGVASSSTVGVVFADAGYPDVLSVCLVVGAGSVPVTGVSLGETTKSLAVGESFTLTATISPENATNKAVTWSSSDAAVASVDENGTVKALKAGTTTITVTTADGAKAATCEVTVAEAAGSGPDSPNPPPGPVAPDTPDAPDTPTDEVSFLETTVTVKGQLQRLRVYDANKILPAGAQLKAEAVTSHEHLDDDHEIEHLLAYDLSLLDAQANPLHMPLEAPVELLFEVPDGFDMDELEVVLVEEFDDAEFEETLVDLDGASWVKVKTNHFSPYALIDKLSPEEKGVQIQDGSGPKNNVTTGDQAVQVAVAGLGMMLVLALGIMLRLITSNRNFEE